MSALGDRVVDTSRVQWSAVFAGAIGAAGLSLALHAFAAGIGLSVLSTAPTWRDSSSWLLLLTGIYLLFVALCAFGFGGYIAGRMRPSMNAPAPESEFRDGIHGLLTWGMATVFASMLALGAAAIAAPSAASTNAGAGQSPSTTAETFISSELDELFRTDRVIPNLSYRRAEAGRILLKSSGHAGISRDDREYLAAITSQATGLSYDRASDRANREISASAQELHRARFAAVLQAFFIGAALFVGAAAAWFAACEGGRERERNEFPVWDWSVRRRT
jgi:hypothetical protein